MRGLSRTVLAVGAAVLGLGAGALGQSSEPAKPKEAPAATKPAEKPAEKPGAGDPGAAHPDAAKPAEKQESKPGAGETSKVGAGAGWPEKVNKKLWATNDYRGRKAPELKVEQWVTKEPERKNKVVLVDFWGTWCPPCRALIPELNQWQKEFKDDLVVIGVSDEPAPTIENFMKSTKVDYAMAVDTRRNDKTKSQIGVQGVPHVLVIDSTGIVRWQGFPQSEEDRLTTEVLKKIVEADRAQRGQRPGEKK